MSSASEALGGPVNKFSRYGRRSRNMLHYPAISTTLAADAVHVWAVPLAVASSERGAGSRGSSCLLAPGSALSASCLSADERERAEHFLRDDLRRRFVVAHEALRAILGRYLGIGPGELHFLYGPHGKPRLAEGGRGTREGEMSEPTSRATSFPPPPSPFPLDLQFSLAHSGELAVVAVTRGGEIGVDVEHLRPVRHLEQLAQRYFTPVEAAAILAGDESRRVAEFLATWTAKEAILKAIGTGLSYPLNRFSVSPAVDGQWVRLAEPPADCGAKWWLKRVDVASGYVAAVAIDSQKSLLPTFHYPDDLAQR